MSDPRIFKYQLGLFESQEILINEAHQILSCQEQSGYITIWALVTPTDRLINKTIEIFGTGNSLPKG